MSTQHERRIAAQRRRKRLSASRSREETKEPKKGKEGKDIATLRGLNKFFVKPSYFLSAPSTSTDVAHWTIAVSIVFIIFFFILLVIMSATDKQPIVENIVPNSTYVMKLADAMSGLKKRKGTFYLSSTDNPDRDLTGSSTGETRWALSVTEPSVNSGSDNVCYSSFHQNDGVYEKMTYTEGQEVTFRLPYIPVSFPGRSINFDAYYGTKVDSSCSSTSSYSATMDGNPVTPTVASTKTTFGFSCQQKAGCLVKLTYHGCDTTGASSNGDFPDIILPSLNSQKTSLGSSSTIEVDADSTAWLFISTTAESNRPFRTYWNHDNTITLSFKAERRNVFGLVIISFFVWLAVWLAAFAIVLLLRKKRNLEEDGTYSQPEE
eukprot:gnl/Dysnectes_brevis/945_a1052_2429.p1 GENE.gnl/Dysnectes_brevis/945_a1052_2429~~gnl/Dysnectes_brevis/945_a1052_2429.p1  ORF type:complete len:387 (+),score=122.68 gnl/Dysnectes_brevis/945_a1052_2429:32-1162(+)